MTIAKRLLLLLAVPLLVLVGLGAYTRYEFFQVETSSRFVSKSQIPSLALLGNIAWKVGELRVHVRDHLLAGNVAERIAIRAAFEREEREVEGLVQQYADHLISNDQDRRLLSDFRILSHEWTVNSRQIMTLAEQGRGEEAAAQLVSGPMAVIGERLGKATSDWIEFNDKLAIAAGDEVLSAIEDSRWRMLVGSLGALVLAGLLGFLTFQKIARPIRALDASVKGIAAGDHAGKVPFTDATDEIGSLARSLEAGRHASVASEQVRWVKTNISEFAGELRGAVSLPEFGQRFLSWLVPLLGGGVAAFYMVEEDASHLCRLAAYGLADATDPADDIRLGQGLVGQCAQERRELTLTQLPPGYLRIASGLGEAVPAQAVAFPLLSGDNLLGVLELAAFHASSEREKALLAELLPVVATSFEILQRTLRTQELLAQTSAIFESATAGIALVRQRHIQRCNRNLEKIFGYEAGELADTSTRAWYANDAEYQRFGEETSPRLARGEPYSGNWEFVRKNGSKFWCRTHGRLLDVANPGAGTVWMLEDVTEERAAAEALREAKRAAEEATQAKSMFLANMSHEIRTPMNAIIGLSHLALKTQLTVKQRDYVSKVHNAGTSLLAIINDILDFSKIEAGKIDIETVDFRLDEVIGSVTTLTAQKANDKGIEFLAEVAPAIPEQLLGDPLRLGQILTNLVNNAVKFTERGEIRLKIELLEQTGAKVQLKFSVRDTGIGMTKEQASRLFQAFAQADMSTTRKHGGTGLGLTISRRLVELMGGQIWLESEPGVGSTFIFTTWLGVGQVTGTGKRVPSEFRDLRVLVVDDNAAAREILVESLGAIAKRADAVSSGPEALAAIKERDADAPYGVVFMDWRMPGMDGLQATRLIKNDASLQHQPAVIIVTAFGREEVREEAEKLHVDGFLEKPVTKSMLMDSLVSVFVAETGETTGIAAATAEDPSRFRGLRILLAEDNSINQQIAVELLEGVGATVDVADNGRIAVEKLGAAPQAYDLLLMDLQMPEMDGHQATVKIRGDARFARLPIVAMTAHATKEERQQCLDAGMNDHVSKPIDPALLFETIGRFYKPAHKERTAQRSAAVPPAAPTPRRGAAELPVVEGLDSADGLLRVAGNRKLYLKLLHQFSVEQAEAPAQIAGQIKSGDRATAERSAHTVKGVAANLGAKAVQAAAGALEKALHEGADAERLAGLQQEFTAVLTPFVERLRDTLGDAPAPPAANVTVAVDPAQLKLVVAQMARHLADFDAAAGDLLEANRGAFASLFLADEFGKFEQQVSGYAFGEAQALLEAAARARGL